MPARPGGGGARPGGGRAVRELPRPTGKGDAARGVPDLAGQPAGYLASQMLLFKADRRSPGDEQLKAVKALMKAIPDATLADLAAFFASQR